MNHTYILGFSSERMQEDNDNHGFYCEDVA